jgi:hypothetical protein
MSFGLFWETVEPENSIALVCKLPTEIIKYIYLGVPIYLSTGFIPLRDGLAMCSIFSVEDDPDAMFFIQRTLHAFLRFPCPADLDISREYGIIGVTVLEPF